MSFIYPSFLWALFAIAIPIIIHFFNFRTHKTVYFSNVAFLQDIEQENKSRNKLKDLLILLMRILTIIALVIAFAHPTKNKNFSSSNKNCDNQFGIYLDNSFSMSALNSEGVNIDLGKSKASDILSALKQNSSYYYLTNEVSSEQQHLYIKDITQNFISTTSTCPKVRKLSFIFSKFNNLFDTQSSDCKRKIFIISDFQKNIFDKENFAVDSNFELILLPIEPIETSNLYIDSIWFESPYHLFNAIDSLTVRIVNTSNHSYSSQQIKLFIDDTLKTLSNFNIEANTSSEIKLKFTNTTLGFIRGKIEIDDYPIDYDNSMFFNYYIAPKVEVLMINGEQNVYLQKFYTDNQYFNLTMADASNIPVGQFSSYQAIILSSIREISTGVTNELKNYISAGGIVLVIPSINANINNLNNFLASFQMPNFLNIDNSTLLLNNINLRDKIYSDAFEEIKHFSEMPVVYSHFKLNKNFISDFNILLACENNDNILIYKEIGSGLLYISAIDMLQKSTNLMTNPVSVPTFYNIPVFAKTDNKIYHTIGNDNVIELKNIKNQEALKLRNIQTGFEFIPSATQIDQNKIKIDFENINLTAGNYQISELDKQVGEISFNYDRNESNLEYYTANELREYVENQKLNWTVTDKTGDFLQNEIISTTKSKSLWKIFIILALVFILGEILIIRLIKN